MTDEHAPYSAPKRTRIRTVTLQQMKDAGERFSMLTSYDTLTAGIFDEAGIELLLVGDSAGNNVLGYSTTIPVTMDEMVMLTRAVSGAVTRALVVADMPFGSYQESPAQAFRNAARLLKEGGAHAVKLEGGLNMVETVRHLVAGGIPVVAHIGFTPQSEHTLGGYRVQGRGAGADGLVDQAVALQDAGAFCVLMEMVPAPVAQAVDEAVRVPTIGIGAGPHTTGQVLVWQDFAGLRGGKYARFVKRYAQLRETLLDAAREYHDDVARGAFPAPEHSFDS